MSRPIAAISATAASNRSTCVARWVQIPSTTSWSHVAIRARSSARPDGWMPMRCIPVSTLTCTGTDPPMILAASIAASTPSSVVKVSVRCAATAAGMMSAGGSESSRIGAVMLAFRSPRPSSTMATASPCAPPSRKASAAVTAPCP